MKFGKEFTSQMVPEWHEKYVDYTHLKNLLKEIHRIKQKSNHNSTHPHLSPAETQRKLALYRVFSGLTSTSRCHTNNPATPTTPDTENSVIVDDSVDYESLNGRSAISYESMFVKEGDEGEEIELMYFRKLDEEFSKVHTFYVSKVEEVMEEATVLEKQMHALVAFRIKVRKPHGWRIDHDDDDDRMNTRASTFGSGDVGKSTRVVSDSAPSWGYSCRRVHIDVIEESSSQNQSTESNDDDAIDEPDSECIDIECTEEHKINIPQSITPCPLQILERITMNVSTLETPLSTIKVLLNVPKQNELKFSKENLKKAEEQLKKAFLVFYHKLRHLKSYSFMNVLAFSKIMKKYDKIASRSVSKAYVGMVENAFLGHSNEVNNLVARVEDTFIKHFSNSNRSKGMAMLRPKPRKEKHSITFSFGFFAGCTVTLLLALVLIIRARNILSQEGASHYMNTMFPLYSMFAFVVLHLIMYAGNIYFWRRYRVNYSFIFGLNQRTELGYRDVLYISFGLAVLALASVLSNLDMEMDPKTHDYKAYTELLPLIVFMVIMGILVCPLNILYRPSRYFFIKCAFRCFWAPLYKVTLADCIMADQLTSQIQAFRSLEFYICYYGWGDYRHRIDTCKTNDVYKTFNFIVAAIPFAIRMFQNVRLMRQTNNSLWGYNAIKYFMTIVAVCTRTAYSLKDGHGWKIAAWITSAVAGIFCTYWDLVVDWGLLQPNSTNRWLRDKLFVPHKSVYFGVMGLNVVLRFAWLQTVLNFKVSSLHTEALIAIVASLEIIRRGIWNFFRLENEHLNNVSQFRAFKSVPLPFNYEEEDEDKDE